MSGRIQQSFKEFIECYLKETLDNTSSTHGESSRHDSVRISSPESTHLPNPRPANSPNHQKPVAQAAQLMPHQQLPEPTSHNAVPTSAVVSFSHHRQPHASTPLIPVVDPSSTGPMSSRIAIPHNTTPFCHNLVPRIIADANAKSVKLHAVLHRRHLNLHHQHH